ncbi:MAG: hypothetical protein IPL33_02105 [Sphingobacteriales bacterium]|nr:hypothetical protein [Sphingobacteriales bacterium]
MTKVGYGKILLSAIKVERNRHPIKQGIESKYRLAERKKYIRIVVQLHYALA